MCKYWTKKYLMGRLFATSPRVINIPICWMDRWPIWTLFVQNWKSKTGNLTRRYKCWISLHHQPDIFKYLLKLSRLLSLCPLCDKRIVVLYKFTFVGVYLKATRSMRQMTDASFESTQCSFPALRRAFVCQRGTQGYLANALASSSFEVTLAWWRALIKTFLKLQLPRWSGPDARRLRRHWSNNWSNEEEWDTE